MPLRKNYLKIFQRNKNKSLLFFIAKIAGFGFLALLLLGTLVFIVIAKDLPRPEDFNEKQNVQSTKIYDRTGEVLLYEIYGEEKRTIIPLSEVSEYLKNAVVATEDKDFYDHFGIDPRGIIRSVLINFKIGSATYGGSTLDQQLIRSTFFSLEKTFERKFKEILLSLELDRRYSKDQILEWYLNQVPFGLNSYGVEAASWSYFGKSASEVTLEEAATLAALIQRPSKYSPYGENKNLLLTRKDYVLDRMAEEGYISQEEADSAKQKEIVFLEKKINIEAPYFTLWVKQQLEDKYGEEYLQRNGLRVYTTLDWDMQQAAETAAKEGIERNKAYNARNEGLVAIDPNTGEVLAMVVGNGDYYADPYPKGCEAGSTCMFDPKFNVVAGIESSVGRQPGSAFKPFVYATAFKNGATPDTVVVDELTNFGIWGEEEYVPQNYDGLFRGPVTLRTALAQSLNVPAVKVLLEIAGLEESVQTAKDMGIGTLNAPYGPSIVLGGWEVKLLEMTSAYGAFANDGMHVQTSGILRIEDYKGNIIEENKKNPKRVLSSNVARTINDILSDNEARAPMFGYYSSLYFAGYDVAAKTGTTENYKDAWAIGYTPSIAVGVWVGNNNAEEMSHQPSVVLSGYIFHRFMELILPTLPNETFEEPVYTSSS
ncbi:MAG: PBP1A family penicillin-binding protein [Candidatus Paceibacterota bacterium]|jgi:penicillin-binding protein 1A